MDAFFPGGVIPEIDDDYLADLELPQLKKHEQQIYRGVPLNY